MAIEKTISIEELFKGEAFRRGNFTCPTAEEITHQYFQNTENVVDNYRIKVWQSDEVLIEDKSTEEIDVFDERPVFLRVLIDGILKDDYQLDFEGDVHKKVISMLYAVDVQNPVAKIFTGYERSACLNLSVFNTKHIEVKKFADYDFNTIYNVIPTYIETVENTKIEYSEKINGLFNTRYANQQLFDIIGKLAFRTSKINGMTTAFNNMVKFLQSNQDVNGIKNIYFNQNWDTEGYSAYDLYQCLTGTLSNKGMKEPEKVFQAYKLVVA